MIRQRRSQHIVDAFFSWCDAEYERVLDDTPISNGIRYARNQRAGLSRFLEDGRLPIHNNMSELALRREAVGRKNWLFVGSDDGGVVNARFTSLLASCQLCDSSRGRICETSSACCGGGPLIGFSSSHPSSGTRHVS